MVSTTLGSIGGESAALKVVNGPPSLRADVFPRLAARSLDGTLIDMISRRYPFERAAEALADLAAAPHTRGKWVVSMA
ncbi:hypothetical protein FAF44_29615 [Nonomuraea sp. MG754425]|uniref:hypothetical protein n=1 Tax=Nonomuraea sp. MG754425 TaxID=2570319 RepID=UPI001F38BBF5|nr:hypothetical protein [Nonomuraea sp. MG754425]MCF6472523.1 hypothetical protein [Nonomuraea sp. MG754425]